MVITLSNNPIDQLVCKYYNWYEKYTHKVWNKKRHYTQCIICGDVMDSAKDKYSPEECGWEQIRGQQRWICHMCDSHRNFKPYIKLIDHEARIQYYKAGKN